MSFCDTFRINLRKEFCEVVTTKKKNEKPVARKPHAPPTSATAASILCKMVYKKKGEVKIKAEWQKFYNHLLELREQLLRQMNGLAKESAQEMAGYTPQMAGSDTHNLHSALA